MEVNYFLVCSKEDDYNACRVGVYVGDYRDLLGHVYSYILIPRSHYEILVKYFDDINDTDYEDFGYDTLADYLEEYY